MLNETFSVIFTCNVDNVTPLLMQWYAGTNLHRIDLKLNFSHLSNQGPKFISRRLKGHDTMMSVWKKSSMIIVSRQRCIARCLRVAQRILENIREKKKKIRGLTSSLLDEWMAKSKSLNSFPIVVSSVYLKIKRRPAAAELQNQRGWTICGHVCHASSIYWSANYVQIHSRYK